MNTAARRLLWVFGVGNSALTLFGAIAVSEANLSAVQSALVLNAAASTIAFVTLGIGELIPRRTQVPTRTTLVNTPAALAAPFNTTHERGNDDTHR